MSGNQVTDRGIFWLCGAPHSTSPALAGTPLSLPLHGKCPQYFQTTRTGPTPLCDTLTHLNMAGALMVTENGLRKAWLHFKKLVEFLVQESQLWQVLQEISETGDWQEYVLPVTTGTFFTLGYLTHPSWLSWAHLPKIKSHKTQCSSSMG